MSDGTTPNPAARLEQLAPMAQEVDSANPSAEQQQQMQAEAEQVSVSDAAAKQWGMLMFTVGGFACMIAPELRPIYAEDRCFAWGQQANAVAEKYGWNGPTAMPELALIASTLGFAVPSWIIIRQRMEQARTAKDGSLLAKLGAWWQHRKDKRAAAMQQQQEPQPGQEGAQP